MVHADIKMTIKGVLVFIYETIKSVIGKPQFHASSRFNVTYVYRTRNGEFLGIRNIPQKTRAKSVYVSSYDYEH